MKITHALLGEHGALKAQFDHLETGVESAASLDAVQSLGGLLGSALASHAAIENEILFPALRSAVELEGPLSVMMAEHDEIEGTLGKLADESDLDRARSLLRHALDVARDHFAKEEEVLFPMAERALGPEALERLTGDWAGRRKVRLA